MPKSIRIATLAEIQNHEQRTNANVRVGGYNMDRLCPIDEIQYFHVELTSADLSRVFLLWEPTFTPHTQNQSCRLVDITATAESMAMALVHFLEELRTRKHKTRAIGSPVAIAYQKST